MYDSEETGMSHKYLLKLVNLCQGIGIMGGWAVYYYVNPEYRKAFGTDYIKSRDVDVLVTRRTEDCLKNAIEKLGFNKSAYYFRYELIYQKSKKKIVSKEKSRNVPIYDLFYVFLDVFTNQSLKKLGAWHIKDLRAKINTVGAIPVVDISTLAEMKSISLFEREKLDKEFKDACDLYALISYSGKSITKTELLEKAVQRIINREDLCDFIAENVLHDPLKSSVVRSVLTSF